MHAGRFFGIVPLALIAALATSLLLSVSLVSAAGPERFATAPNGRGKVAVVFSDVKFDDKAAVWSLLADPQYQRVVVVTSGINKHRNAAQELVNFVDRQNENLGSRNLKDKLKLIEGGNPLGMEAPHEVWYNGVPAMQIPRLNARDMHRELAGKKVAIFQIAPAQLDDVKLVIDSADHGTVQSLMLLHGYNSRQADMAAQERFLLQLRPLVKRNNPEGEVYFTSSFQSYAAKDGGKQPLQWVAQRFAPYDVDQAMRDPFWSQQIRAGSQFLPAGHQSPLPLHDREGLDRYIFEARRDPTRYAARRHAIYHHVDAILNSMSAEQKQERARLVGRLENTFKPEFGGAGTTIEMADAAHIAHFHRAQAANGAGGVWARYERGVTAPGAAAGFQQVTHPAHADGVLLQGGHTALDRAWIDGLVRSVRG
jgi:hypothetical protein